MSKKIDWTKARKQRPSTDTIATKRLDYRADRYLEVADQKKPSQDLAHERECEAAAMAVLRERKRKLTRQFVAVWEERLANANRKQT